MTSLNILLVLLGIISLTGSVGCCHAPYHQECSHAVPVWTIILSVMGAILFLSAVAIYVYIYYFKCGKRGRIIHSSNNTQPVFITATTYPAHYYGMRTTELRPPGWQPSVHQSNNSNLRPEATSTLNQREGLQSEPPIYGGLPGSHQVV